MRAGIDTINAGHDRTDGQATGCRQENATGTRACAQRVGAEFQAIGRRGNGTAGLQQYARRDNIGYRGGVAVQQVANCAHRHISVAVTSVARHNRLQRDILACVQCNGTTAAPRRDVTDHGQVAPGQQINRPVGKFCTNIGALQQVLPCVQADVSNLTLDCRVQHDVGCSATGLQ